jgi:sortase A
MNGASFRSELVWKGDVGSGPRWVRAAEWIFLLAGLAAVDVFVWVNTSTLLDQAYQDWSFDETLRGLQPTIKGFVADEIFWLFGGHTKTEKIETEVPQKLEPVPREKPPLHEQLLGRLSIPRLKVSAMVREGADSATLRRAVGHIPGTALPGHAGNVALAGHRDTFFRALRDIKKDDKIDIETESGTYQYVVESTNIVGPRDVGVLAASRDKSLTLVTCYPFYYVGSAPKRFIVRATETGGNTPRQRVSAALDSPVELGRAYRD